MSYLCNRNRETKIANDKVPWMSGLVSGLQNRVRRFDSATYLTPVRVPLRFNASLLSFQKLTLRYIPCETVQGFALHV